MEYINSINIFGTEYKPNSCIILDDAPTVKTPALIGMLALDTKSKEKDLYKCVAINEGNYEWRKLNSGSGNTSAEIVDSLDNVPKEERNEFTDYYVKNGDKYLHYRWNKTSEKFVMISGESAKFLNSYNDLTNITQPNEFTSYYVKETITDSNNNSKNIYYLYRWDKQNFIPVGIDESLLSQKITDLREELVTADTKLRTEMKNLSGNVTTLSKEALKRESLHITFQKGKEGANSKLLLHDTPNYTGEEEIKQDNIISSTDIIGGTGGGGGGETVSKRLILKKEDAEDVIIVPAAEGQLPQEIKIKFTAKFQELTPGEEKDTWETQSAKLSYKIRVNGREEQYGQITSGDDPQEINIAPLIKNVETDSEIKLTVFYNEAIENTDQVISYQKDRTWVVSPKMISLLPSDKDFDKTLKISSPVRYYCTPFGEGLSKNIYYKIGDNKAVLAKANIITSGLEVYIDIPLTEHGANKVEIWCESTIERGEGKENIHLSSDHYFYSVMYKAPNVTTPIIRLIADPKATLERYYKIPFYYSVYSFKNEKVDITIKKDLLETVKEDIGRTEQSDYFIPETWGEKRITVSYTEKEGEEEITYSASIILDIADNAKELPTQVEANLALDFNPKNRSNKDSDYDQFKIPNPDYTGAEGEEQFINGWDLSDNFDWVNGGWKNDENGTPCFCIKANTYVDFNYKLFGDPNILVPASSSTQKKGNGKELKVVFKTSNVANVNAKWLSCEVEGDPVGLQMRAQEGLITSSEGSLRFPYSEEDVIEFDLNITPLTFNDNGEIDSSVKDIAMIMTYEDGTPVQPKIISNKTERLYQLEDKDEGKEAAPVRIGSPDCDVYIYRMKIYSKSLTEKEILKNFVADAEGYEKMQRFLRNELFLTNNPITLSRIKEAFPDLRIVTISAPHFTDDKSNLVPDTEIQMIYENGKGFQNWIATNCAHSGQGTSSNSYGYAARNLRLVFNHNTIKKKAEGAKEGRDFPKPIITFNDGTSLGGDSSDSAKIKLTDNSIPVDVLNIKVNVASSEHSNNALLAKRYHDNLPYKMYAQNRYPETIPDNDNNPLNNEFAQEVRNTMDFYNCVVFIQETDDNLGNHKEFNDKEFHFYSLGNIGDYKDTDDIRVSDPDDDYEFCNEILDWNKPLANFPVNKYVSVRDYVIIDNNIESRPFEEVAEALMREEETRGEVKELVDGIYLPTSDSVMQEVPVDSEGKPNYADAKKYYIDALKYDDYEGDFTYEFRYIRDNDKATAFAKSAWENFYNFVIEDTWERNEDNIIMETDPATGQLRPKIDKVKGEFWKTKLKEWFIPEAAYYYYLFTLRYTMVDNRAKNSFWHYGKTGVIRTVSSPTQNMLPVYYESSSEQEEGAEQLKNLEGNEGYYKRTSDTSIDPNKTYYTQYAFDFWDYDNDTALGIDNTGHLEIDYGVEDQDLDGAGVAYFRAHDSTFFVKLSRLFEGELTSAYNSYSNNFSASSLITQFDEWQQEFSEGLWQLDYETKYKRTYVGGYGSDWDNRIRPAGANTDFLQKMMNGRKKFQRRQFEREQEGYMRSKFNPPTSEGRIVLRGRGDEVGPNPQGLEPIKTITITPYSKTYINLYQDDTTCFAHKRALPGNNYTFNYPSGMDGKTKVDFIYVQDGQRLSSFGDISLLYLQTAQIGSGRKLIDFIPGNEETMYNNSSIQEVQTTKTNTLLELLNISNLFSIKGISINELFNLKVLKAEGTSLQGVDFANNGLIREAYLPETVKTINAKNLYTLETLTCTKTREVEYTGEPGTLEFNITKITPLETPIEQYYQLQDITFENCPLLPGKHLIRILREATQSEEKDALSGEVIQPKGQLRRLSLTNINWSKEDGCDIELLSKLLTLGSSANITGKIYLIGNYRARQIEECRALWPDLVIDTTNAQVIEEVQITYLDWDNEVVHRQYIDIGTSIPFITEEDLTEGDKKLNKPEDEKFRYTFLHWKEVFVDGEGNVEDLDNGKVITSTDRPVASADTVVKAVYEEQPQVYTVIWKTYTSRSPFEQEEFARQENVAYMSEAVIDETSMVKALFGYRSSVSDYYGKLFKGWDTNTGYIKKSNKPIDEGKYTVTVEAIWEETYMKDALAAAERRNGIENAIVTEINGYYDNQMYQRRRERLLEVEQEQEVPPLSAVQVYTLSKSIDAEGNVNQLGPQILERLKNVFVSGSNIEITMGHDFTFQNTESIEIVRNGETKFFVEENEKDPPMKTNIALMNENKAFTFVIDFEFTKLSPGGTLLSFRKPGSSNTTFRISASDGVVKLFLNESEHSRMSLSNKRNIFAFRYDSSKELLQMYRYSGHSDFPTSSVNVIGINVAFTTELIELGAIFSEENPTESLGNCAVYWCKLWREDLGENSLKKLVTWPREKIRMQYMTSNDKNYTPNGLTFMSEQVLLDRSMSLVLKTGAKVDEQGRAGWGETLMSQFLNNRFYNGMPENWKNSLRLSTVKSLVADTESLERFSCYVYIPATIEFGVKLTDKYAKEGVPFSLTHRGRAASKYSPFDLLYRKVIESSEDPYNKAVEGDLWKRGVYYYVRVSQETVERYQITPTMITTNTDAQREGGWIGIYATWTRSPYNKNNFYYVSNQAGIYAGQHLSRTNSLYIIPMFSI